MTREELLKLEHLEIATVTKFVHLHTEPGYVITPWFDGMDILEYSGSACYYMPIRDNYVDYRVITEVDHLELEKQRKEAEIEKEKEKDNE